MFLGIHYNSEILNSVSVLFASVYGAFLKCEFSYKDIKPSYFRLKFQLTFPLFI